MAKTENLPRDVVSSADSIRGRKSGQSKKLKHRVYNFTPIIYCEDPDDYKTYNIKLSDYLSPLHEGVNVSILYKEDLTLNCDKRFGFSVKASFDETPKASKKSKDKTVPIARGTLILERPEEENADVWVLEA